MRRWILCVTGAALLGGCQSLLTLPMQPGEPDTDARYDKTVETQTVRDCLSGEDERSGQPGRFYQKRDRRDAEERQPAAPYGETP